MKISPDKTILRIYIITCLASIIWIGFIVAAPVLQSQGHPLGAFIYGVFAPTCHQLPSRCFSFAGFPLAVCSRCFGIYIGFLTGLFHYPFRRGFSDVALPKTKTLIIVSLPIALDAAVNFLKGADSPLLLRFATGWIWGQVLPYYWMTGLLLFFQSLQKKPPKKMIPSG